MNQAQPVSPELLEELESLRARVRELEHAGQEQHERSRSLLHATIESTADGLLVVDLEGNVLLFNQRFLELAQVPAAVAATCDRAKFVAHVRERVKDPEQFVERLAEWDRNPDQDGFDEVVYLDGRILERYSRPQRIGGRSVGRVVSIRDVTERRQMEQRLRESEGRYRHLFAHTPVSIWEQDYMDVARWLDGLRREGVSDLAEYLAARPEAIRQALQLVRIRDVSDASLSIFDAPGKEQLIAGATRLFTDESYRRFGEMLVSMWEGRTQGGSESEGVTLKGRRLDLLVHWAVPLQDGRPDLSRVVVVIDDMTERVRLQHELLQSQKLESVGTLAGGIAHDFNNLLAVVVGQASVQLRDRTLPVRLRESLKDILHAAERGSALTQQLLAYARGGLRKPAPVDLNAVVDSVMKILRRTLPPQVEFALKLSGELAQVMADPSQIEQVVMNLCLNAAQASRVPGRVEVTTEGAVLDEEQAGRWDMPAGEQVKLCVRDFGRGMDVAVMQRLFEPFFTTKPEGRGMGLAVTMGIVKSHKGHIEVSSALGLGTTMTVWLPAIQAPKEAGAGPAHRPRTAPLPRGSETVLVIEDEPAVMRTLETMLASLGYCVLAHGEPEDALAQLERNSEDIHLVLLDANLPRFPLTEMFDRVRALCPHAPVLLASGFDLQQQCEPIIKRGAAGFVQKPFSMVTLATQVRAALDKTARG